MRVSRNCRQDYRNGKSSSAPSTEPALAVHTAGAVVARADRGVSLVERLALDWYLQRCKVEALKSPLGSGLFGKCLRELDRDPASEQSMLARVLADFKGTPWAWVILRAAEARRGRRRHRA